MDITALHPNVNLENSYRIVEIDQDYYNDINSFSSGNGSMDSFLKEEAYYRHIEFSASTMLVYCEKTLVAFFTLTQSKIKFDEFESFPSLDLARLAVESNYQSNGVGTFIIEHVINLARLVCQRFITLDALLEKLDWYQHRGFNYLIEDEIDESKNATGLVYMMLDLYDPTIVETYFDE